MNEWCTFNHLKVYPGFSVGSNTWSPQNESLSFIWASCITDSSLATCLVPSPVAEIKYHERVQPLVEGMSKLKECEAAARTTSRVRKHRALLLLCFPSPTVQGPSSRNGVTNCGSVLPTQ